MFLYQNIPKNVLCRNGKITEKHNLCIHEQFKLVFIHLMIVYSPLQICIQT